MASLPTGWSQQEFNDWYDDLARQADIASDQSIRLRSEPYIQKNVDEWLATGTTTSPLPTAWSMKEFSDWMAALEADAQRVYDQFILSRTPPELIGISRVQRPAWAWPDDQLVFHLDMRNQRYWSKLLGDITVAQAFTAIRATSNNLAFDSNGLLVQFTAATPRITAGMGLWIEGSAAGRIDFNDDYSNAAWVKTGVSLVQDLPSPFAAGTPLGWRVTATAANATLMQTAGVVSPAAGAGGSDLIISSLFYLPTGVTLAGDLQLTQDGGTTWTSVKTQLITTRWVHCPGSIQPNPGTGPVCGMRLTAAGDSIGLMLMNIDRGYLINSPIRVPGAGATSRGAEQCKLNMASFPPMHNAAMPRFTMLVVVEPMQVPLPPLLDANRPRFGWTAMEFNDDDTITATGQGQIASDVMTVTSMTSGAFAVGQRLLTGSGALSYTDIISLGTGTGQTGTYNVHSSLSGTGTYPPTQTSPANIALISRVKDAQGYGHNSAIKTDGAQQIGVTYTNELVGLGPGLDPQIAEFTYNEPNAMGWSMDTLATPAPKSHIALKGDVYTSTDVQLFASPQLGTGCYIMVGSQGGATSPTGPLRGIVRELIGVGRAYNAPEMASATSTLQPEAAEVTAWASSVVSNGGTVSSARRALLSQLTNDIKAAKVWDLIDDFVLLVAENMTQVLTSFKQRRLGVAVSSPNFTVDRGVMFSASSYIDTGFIPATHKVAMTGTSMHIAVYERTNLASTSAAAGCLNTNSQSLIMQPRRTDGIMGIQLNSLSSGPAGDVMTDSRGLSVGSRNGTLATDVVAYKNGVPVVPFAPGAMGSALPTSKLYIGCRADTSNVAGSFRNATQGFVSVGAALPATQQVLFYNAIQKFMTAVGANV